MRRAVERVGRDATIFKNRSVASAQVQSRVKAEPTSMRDLLYKAVQFTRATTGVGRAKNYRQFEAAIVLLLPEEARRPVRRWQLEILRRYGRCPGFDVPPHVTLKLGFKCQPVDRLADELTVLAGRSKPVALHLKDIALFDEDILFMDLQPSPAFEALRQSVIASLIDGFAIEPRPIEREGFHPHVTLTRDLSRHQLEAERSRLSRLGVEYRVTADRMALLLSADDRWIDYRTYTLGMLQAGTTTSDAGYAIDRD